MVRFGHCRRVIKDYASWIYGACALVAMWYLRAAIMARRDRRSAVFSLEREAALNRTYNAWSVAFALILVIGVVYLLSTVIVLAVQPLDQIDQGSSLGATVIFVPAEPNTASSRHIANPRQAYPYPNTCHAAVYGRSLADRRCAYADRHRSSRAAATVPQCAGHDHVSGQGFPSNGHGACYWYCCIPPYELLQVGVRCRD